MDYTETNSCRACGSPRVTIRDFGNVPLANGFLTTRDEQPQLFPLTLTMCSTCSLVQLRETVDPKLLFGDYPYFSSQSAQMVASSTQVVNRLMKELKLDTNSLAVELGSNDGYLLQHYVKASIPVLGIEPAAPQAQAANHRGVRTISKFFGFDVATELSAQFRADIIHANNVIAHVANLNDVIAGVKKLLKPEGVFVVEVPYVADLVDNCEFDTIYHEHLCYFAFSPLLRLLVRHGLFPYDVEHIPLHGGSLRIYSSPMQRGTRKSTVDQLLYESRNSILTFSYYKRLGERIEGIGRTLRGLLSTLRSQGKLIVGYGASAKGTMLLNQLELGEFLAYVVDTTPAKQGKFIPGTGLEILPTSRLVEDKPDYALLLAWNWQSEIVSKESVHLRTGGRFIVPIPSPKILEDANAYQPA